MKTLTVDANKRVRIPDSKPHEVFSYTRHEDGRITLVPMKAAPAEMFPPGSLLKYITPERDKEVSEIAAGCVQGPE